MAHSAQTRLWLAKLTVLAVAVIVSVGMIEIFLRVSGRDAALLWEPEPELGWYHIPYAKRHWTEEGDGWAEINSLGMRDVERAVPKPPGVFRIAVFGDSMTEAVQVNLEQTYEQLLEKHLRARGARVEVLNFGINGYGPLQSYLLYQQIGKKFAPDLVLHAIFLDNDVADLHPALAVGQEAPFVQDTAGDDLVVDRSRAERSYRNYHREPVYTIRRASALYRAVSRQVIRIEGAAGPPSNDVPRRYLLYETPAQPAWDQAWRSLERVVTAFARDVSGNGGRYMIISVPAGQLVYDDAWAKLLTQFPAMTQRKWDLSGPERRLQALASRHAIGLIAPFADFRANAPKARLFFGLVGHMTPAGHQVMASSLERSLASIVPVADRD